MVVKMEASVICRIAHMHPELLNFPVFNFLSNSSWTNLRQIRISRGQAVLIIPLKGQKFKDWR